MRSCHWSGNWVLEFLRAAALPWLWLGLALVSVGARAKEALQSAGLWPAIESKLVLGENISQTAQFATSGSTQGGIIALSLAKSPSIAKLGEFALIPESMHKPLNQRMVLMKDAPPALRAFYEHLGTPAAQTIMVRYGFAMPKLAKD